MEDLEFLSAQETEMHLAKDLDATGHQEQQPISDCQGVNNIKICNFTFESYW